MSKDNNIQQFTAADIERYHKGLLSNKEMHDLEKAAMDDPFLADALEGYTVAGVNREADLAELTSRLELRTNTAKIVPINSGGKNNFSILRAAVVIAFIAGAGLLIYQFGFNKKSDSLAQNREEASKPLANDINPDLSKKDSFASGSSGSVAANKNQDVTSNLSNTPNAKQGPPQVEIGSRSGS